MLNNSTVTIDSQDVKELSKESFDTAMFNSNSVVVFGTSADLIQSNETWTQTGVSSVTIGSNDYHVFELNNATLIVDDDINSSGLV